MPSLTERMWHDYHARLRGFILKRVADPACADDILQDVFLKAHSRIGTLRDEEKVQSWLYNIARNAIIDHYRARKTLAELPEFIAAAEEDPGDAARKDVSGCVAPLIDGLPDLYREALALSEVEGLRQKEVAARLGLSLPGAKARIRRGRAMVKDLLLQCCTLEFDHRGAMVDYEPQGPGCGCDRC